MGKNSIGRVSAIVITYNRSGHLGKCLASLETQTRLPDEVVVADDGSDPEHVEVIGEAISKSPLKVAYVRQERKGHRTAANRNNGARRSTGDYLIFIDCDAVLFPNVVEEHLKASSPRHWVIGQGLWLTEEETARLSEDVIRSGKLEEFWDEVEGARTEKMLKRAVRFRKEVRKARLWPSERRLRKVALLSLHHSLYRSAFEKVNGYDENYVGWGRQDKDLGLRLQFAGIRGRTVADKCRVLHQYHEPALRPIPGDPSSSFNAEYYDRPRKRTYWCEKGLRVET